MAGYLPGQAALVATNVPMIEAWNQIGTTFQDADGRVFSSRAGTDAIRIVRGREETPTLAIAKSPVPSAASHGVLASSCAGTCYRQVVLVVSNAPSFGFKQITYTPQYLTGGCLNAAGVQANCCVLTHNPGESPLNKTTELAPTDGFTVPVNRIVYYVDSVGRLMTTSLWADNHYYCDTYNFDLTEDFQMPVAQGIEDLQLAYGLDTDGDEQVDHWYNNPTESGLVQAASYIKFVRVTLAARGGRRLTTALPVSPTLIEDHSRTADSGFNLSEYRRFVHRQLTMEIQTRNIVHR
jgi:hypothetical protein